MRDKWFRGEQIARGPDGRCHVLALRNDEGEPVTACGVAWEIGCGDASYGAGSRCPVHGEPLCPDCLRFIRKHSPKAALCHEPGCGELIEYRACWCTDHGMVCDGGLYEPEPCTHPAHDCQEPVHYCEDHGGEPS